MNKVTELSWPQLRRDLTDQCERLVSIRNRKIEELEDANTTLMAAQKVLLEWDLSHDWKKYQEAKSLEQLCGCGSGHTLHEAESGHPCRPTPRSGREE